MVSMYEVQIPAANDIKGAWNHEDGTYSIFVEACIVQLSGTVKMQSKREMTEKYRRAPYSCAVLQTVGVVVPFLQLLTYLVSSSLT